MPVPTTLVTGPLGVGKTTAILGLLGHRPPGERWAVLVNEFGQVGIDGAVLGSVGGIEVREIAGGCICCTANLPLRVALVRLLREVKPDRLIVEPTGLAHPAAVLDVIRSRDLRASIAARATITLVDPRKLAPADPLWADQVRAADVLVANWSDRATEAQIAAFRAWASGLYPPPAEVAVTAHGRLDPRWLDLDPTPRGVLVVPPESAAPGQVGLVWPPDRIFDLGELQELLQTLVRPGALPHPVLRLKGVFATPRGFLRVDADPETVRFEPVGWRRDSRVEILVDGPAPDGDELLARFAAAAI